MTFSLGNIVVLLILAVIALQFWRIRGISEWANRYVAQYCKKHQLQLISVARHKTRLTFYKGKLDWYNEFIFEFSGNGEDSSQGTLTAIGMQALSTELPPYRVP